MSNTTPQDFKKYAAVAAAGLVAGFAFAGTAAAQQTTPTGTDTSASSPQDSNCCKPEEMKAAQDQLARDTKEWRGSYPKAHLTPEQAEAVRKAAARIAADKAHLKELECKDPKPAEPVVATSLPSPATATLPPQPAPAAAPPADQAAALPDIKHMPKYYAVEKGQMYEIGADGKLAPLEFQHVSDADIKRLKKLSGCGFGIINATCLWGQTGVETHMTFTVGDVQIGNGPVKTMAELDSREDKTGQDIWRTDRGEGVARVVLEAVGVGFQGYFGFAGLAIEKAQLKLAEGQSQSIINAFNAGKGNVTVQCADVTVVGQAGNISTNCVNNSAVVGSSVGNGNTYSASNNAYRTSATVGSVGTWQYGLGSQ